MTLARAEVLAPEEARSSRAIADGLLSRRGQARLRPTYSHPGIFFGSELIADNTAQIRRDAPYSCKLINITIEPQVQITQLFAFLSYAFTRRQARCAANLPTSRYRV